MTYRRKNRCKLNGICLHCQGDVKPQEQRFKKRFKSNFQTRNKRKICDLKTKTQDVHNKHEDEPLFC
jgi:hypothetical protein